MLTTTAEKSVLTPEKEDIQLKQQVLGTITAPQKKQTIKPKLKKIDLYVSVLGLVLVICFLLSAIKVQDVIKIEGYKALLAAGILNLIRILSISKH